MINNKYNNTKDSTTTLEELNDKLQDDIFKVPYNELMDRLDILIEKNNKQEGFLLNISHDLRAHLNVILSVVQCIESGNVEVADKKVIEYISMVKRNSLKMLKLVNNLIDATKFENNYYTIDKKNIDIISMVEGTVSCIDRYAKQKNIQLIFDTNKEECIAAIDPEVIDRIIMNLLSNAIKFSPINTNIFINMFIDENNIKISIKDEGPGISDEDKEKIFNRFFQTTKKKENENTGSGIGLDLVNYLTKSHDGEVSVVSENGDGTEFIVKIPRVKIEESDDITIRCPSAKIQMLEIEFSDIYLS